MRWLVVLAAGCGLQREPQVFVRDARLVGWNLAVDKCEVSADHDRIRVRSCATSMQPLPVLIEPPPTTVSAARRLAKVLAADTRDALERCVTAAHIDDTVRLVLTFGPKGGITAIDPSAGGRDLAACARGALAGVRVEDAADTHVTLHVLAGGQR